MEKSKIDRINELAHKAKKTPLSAEEKVEQAALRKEFIAEIRGDLKRQLDNIEFVDEPAEVEEEIIEEDITLS
jgi:uncharacterized protein YnzC (UPF0291/DUF896 family)